MEEQVNIGTTAPRTTRTVPLLVLLVVIAAAVVGAYVVISKRGPINDPASYIPKDAVMALTVDITSTPDKKAAMAVIGDICKAAGEEKPVDSLFNEIGKGLELNFEKDVASHLNGTAAFAVLNKMSGQMPQMVGMFGTKTKADADAIMTTIGNKLNKHSVTFSRNTYQGISYYSIMVGGASSPSGLYGPPKVENCVGAVKSAVVYADSKEAFEKVVDTANGKPSLLSDSNYVSLRKSGPKTVGTTYFSGVNFYELIGPYLQLAAGMAPPGTVDNVKKSCESLTAMVGTLEASAEGLKYTLVSLTTEGSTIKCMSIDDMVKGAPKEAAVVMSLGNLDDLWNEYKTLVAKNPVATTQFDQLVQKVQASTGLDLRADILDRLKTLQAYYVPGSPAKPDGFPGEINAVLQVDNPQMANQTVQRLHMLAAMSGGASFTETTTAGHKTYVLPLGPTGETLTDTIVGDKLLVHITGAKNTMAGAIAQLSNPGPGLESDPDFQIVKSQISNDAVFMVYGNVGTIIKKFSQKMSPEDRKVAETIIKKVGAFGVSATGTGNRSDLQVVIPFYK